jgi:hypothetical protein
MKPFDLEAAKAGAKLVTRDGRLARFVAHLPECDRLYRVIVLIDGDAAATALADDGRFCAHQDKQDLFMAPERLTRFVNLFPDGVAYWFDTEAEARAGLNARALKIAVPVTFEV